MKLSDIRESARNALKGKWGKAVLIVLIYGLFSYLLGLIGGLVKNIPFLNFVISIGTIIISIPVSFGLIISFIKIKNGEDIKCYDFLTFGFSKFKRSWKVTGNILLKLWLPILLYILAIIIFVFMSIFTAALYITSSSFNSSTLIIINIIGICLIIATSIFLFIRSLSYALSYFIAYDNEEKSAKEVVEESNKLMQGNRWKYVLLQLSFIGWAILSVLTIYIGMLWLVPYMQIASICFYEYLKENKNKDTNVEFS